MSKEKKKLEETTKPPLLIAVCGLWFVSEAKPCVVGLMTTNRCYLLGGLSALNLI